MHLSKKKRLKRAKATRMKIRELGVSRLTVTRTPKHIYAQVTSAQGNRVLAQASSLDKEIRDENNSKNSFMETGLPLITLIGTFICMGISVMNRQNGYEEDIIKLCDYQTIEFRR